MYIQPSSNLKLYSSVPLDNTYEHTLYFQDRQAQNNYFHGVGGANVVKSFPSLTYVRVNKGSVKVEARTSEIYNANYMAFKNEQFENKWFYAFVTKIDYLNNETCEIFYEIDEMQTWFLDCELLNSFVEREHAVTDEVGDNLLSENFPQGLIEYGKVDKTPYFGKYAIIVVSPYDRQGNSDIAPSAIFGGFSGMCCLPFVGSLNESGALYEESITNKLAKWLLDIGSAKIGNIVAMYMYPVDLLPDWSYSSDNVNGLNSYGASSLKKQMILKKPTTLGNYTPRNKKLLTYPFNYLHVETYGGESADYQYELFRQPYDEESVQFEIIGDPSASSSIKAVPSYYKGLEMDNIDAVYMNDLPFVSWTSDTFRSWWANNKGNITTGLVNAFVGSAVSGNGGSLITHISSIIGSAIDSGAKGGYIKGNQSGLLEVQNKTLNFNFYQCYLNTNQAQMIDGYFDKYGYTTNQIKKPNINARKHWTYTKTNGCVLKGNAPVDSINSIIKCFDRGITFWKNANEVGKYTEYADDNTPL